jgi:hypothetical protein
VDVVEPNKNRRDFAKKFGTILPLVLRAFCKVWNPLFVAEHSKP